MKPQDVLFILILGFLLYKRDTRLLILSGSALLVFSIPLFNAWIFFTAERLTWYAGLLFLFAILFFLRDLRKGNK